MELAWFRNPTMHLFHIPRCTIQNRNVHISVLNVALWDMKLVDCEISEVSLLSFCCSIQISLMYVPRALIYNMPILVQIMALCQTVIVFVSTRHYVNQCWPTIYASLKFNSKLLAITYCLKIHYLTIQSLQIMTVVISVIFVMRAKQIFTEPGLHVKNY